MRENCVPDGYFAEFRAKRFIVPAMLQCGKAARHWESRRTRVQHAPPDGTPRRGERLAPGYLLGFNLNKVG